MNSSTDRTTKPFVGLCITGLTLISVSQSVSAQQTEPRPNIILIMSDDQAWGDFELNGNQIIDTPNLNKIATEGVQFERFYVNPMCAPTRASLLTGRYNLRSGTSWVGRRTEMMNLQEITIANILKSNGYATGCFGKWHLGSYGPYHPNSRGFDEFTGFLDGAADDYFRSELDHNNKKFTSDKYITDLLTDSAMAFIEKNQNNPFFCYIPYNVPHHPHQVPEKYSVKYKERGITEVKTAAVYGMVENMDENIGRIIGRLELLNLDKKTIIVFLSDNGPAFQRYNDGLSGIKAEVGEGSVRVPFLIKWEGTFPAGKRVFDIAAHIDFLPTILDILNIQAPANLKLDGISLLPLIKGNKSPEPDRAIFTHQTVFGECLMTPGGLRTNNYRLVNWNKGYELYDMNKDPFQKRNIASVNPELTNQLVQKYETWYKDVTSGVVPSPPIPVGYPGFNETLIGAPDVLLSSQLQYKSKYGWFHDYILNWKSLNDSIVVPIDVLEQGEYEFLIEYFCNKEDLGSVVQLTNGNKKINQSLNLIQENPAPISKTENAKKPEWVKQSIGKMKLTKGRTNLIIQAVRIQGKEVCFLRSVTIKTNKL